MKIADRLETLSNDAETLSLIPFWKLRGEIEPLEPKKPPYRFGGSSPILSPG